MFIVDKDTRVISTSDVNDFVLGCEGDCNSEIKQFQIPRYADEGWDLSTGAIRISYTNANGELGNYTISADEMTVADDTITVDWLIGSSVCVQEGTVTFGICSILADADGNLINAWAGSDVVKGVVLAHTCNTDFVPASVLADATASAIASIQAAGENYETKTAHEADVNQLKEDLTDHEERITALENGGGSGSGVSESMKNTLLAMFKVCAYSESDVSTELSAFKEAWGIEESEPTLENISAVDNQTSYPAGTDASDLDLTVTATYSDSSTEVVTGWTASGTVAEGENTFTISYGGKSCTVTVTGESSTNYVSGMSHQYDGINNTESGHDSTSQTWYDLVGDADLASFAGTQTWEDDALVFGGSNAVKCSMDKETRPTVQTIEVCIDTSSATFQTIAGYGDTVSDVSRNIIYSGSDNTLDGYSSSHNLLKNPVVISELHTISVVYNSATTGDRKLYVNGTEVTDTGATHSLSDGIAGIWAGFYNSSSKNYSFKGKMHSFRIYDKALSASEIANNYSVDQSRFNL